MKKQSNLSRLLEIAGSHKYLTKFCREAEEAAPKPADVVKDRIFIPAEPVED